jgi:hypothetical protein
MSPRRLKLPTHQNSAADSLVTYPLGLFVCDKTLNWFIAVGVGGVLNFVLLYSLLWIAGYAFRKGNSNSDISKSG